MKKSSFAAMSMAVPSALLFAIGMCMVMLPEWNAFRPGVILGGAGIILALLTVWVWRKMEHKAPVKFSAMALMTVALSLAGVLALGIGMCFCMVWNSMVPGIVIGLVGIMMLLCLIPMVRGIK